jgi:glycosyltransferase involved in cell wall biosynthesis
MNIALVHDDLVQSGGAERVVALFHKIWPQAPLYTSIYDRRTTLRDFDDAEVRTSFLQRTPLSSRRLHKLALPLFPAAFEGMDFTGYDLILSSSSRFAKGVITGPRTCHVCYCYTPPRFAWRPQDYFGRMRAGSLIWLLMWPLLSRLRRWDLESAAGVDYYIAISHNVARRIRKFYRRDSAVIHPPVDTDRYRPAAPDQIGDYFLVVSRLVGYKRVDLAVEACNRLGLPLKVIGGGPEERTLRRKAGPTVEFLGHLPDAEVVGHYARCRALIFAGEEDFGLTPLEAMASGRPVVAFGAGGALETVIEGRTGLFFGEQTVDSLAGALQSLDGFTFEPDELRAHALRFDTAVFREQITRFIDEAVAEHRRLYSQGQISKTLSTDPRTDPASLRPSRRPK